MKDKYVVVVDIVVGTLNINMTLFFSSFLCHSISPSCVHTSVTRLRQCEFALMWLTNAIANAIRMSWHSLSWLWWEPSRSRDHHQKKPPSHSIQYDENKYGSSVMVLCVSNVAFAMKRCHLWATILLFCRAVTIISIINGFFHQRIFGAFFFWF